MTLIIILKTILLGLIEGVTEFLPISSTGHLIIFSDILKFAEVPNKSFEISIQFGAILAVIFTYHKKLTHLAFNYFKEKESRNFCHNILVAFLPAMVLGALFHDYIVDVLFSPIVVGLMLIIGGIIIIIVEAFNFTEKTNKVEKITLKQSLIIGFCQALAMIPGTSRSGSTIIGSMIIGINRKTAAEFSFFLAIPTMLAATVYSLLKNARELNFDDISLILIGFTTAFLAALVAIKTFLNFLNKHKLNIFAYYRIIIGSAILLYYV